MATYNVAVEPSETECAVCHQYFTLPKILPCGHLMCRHCITTWMKTKPDAGCPICRCAILEDQDKQAGRSVKETVDDLPTDLVMDALAEAHRLLSKQNVCCICNKTAGTICMDCGDIFCRKCERIHVKQSVTKHHKLEKLNTLTAEKVAARRPVMCADHKEKSCEAFCSIHGATVCLLCATTTHRQCQQVISLEARMQESMAEFDHFMAYLLDGETTFDLSINRLDQHIKTMQKHADDALQEIQEICQRLESAVKECRRRLEDMTRKVRADVTQKVSDVKAVLLQRRSKVSSHKTVTERAIRHKEICSVTDLNDQLKKRIISLSNDTITPIFDEQVTSFAISIDHKAVARIEKELSQLGNVNFTPLTGVPMLQAVALQFHSNHGKKIRLSNNSKTAERTDYDLGDGVVIARDPMQPQLLYEVKVEAVNESFNACQLGVLTRSPDNYKTPTDFFRSDKSILCLCQAGLYAFGKQKDDARLRQMYEVPGGTLLGFALDEDRNLHLYLGGSHLGVVATNIPHPAYFVVDLISRCLKVTAQPVKRINWK